MVQVVKKLFDGNRKAVFSFNATIASTTAESYTVNASDLNSNVTSGATCASVDINSPCKRVGPLLPTHGYIIS